MELLVIVGPSGCGKTTLLKILTGVETPDSGHIWLDNREITQLPPKDRQIALCFQTVALYPHLTSKENIRMGLDLQGISNKEIEGRINEIAKRLEIQDLLKRKPREMSGGQKQRVALARALARKPKVLLLDEPLSSLDAQLRTSMRTEIKRIHQESGTTTMCVTHDQVEAMTLANRVVVMEKGKILQIDTPNNIYAKPATAFVAQFIGNPAANIFEAEIKRDGNLTLQSAWITTELAGVAPGNIIAAIRPENIRVKIPSPNAVTRKPMQVELIESLGDSQIIHINNGHSRLVAKCPPSFQPQVGQDVAIEVDSNNILLFTKTGEPLTLPPQLRTLGELCK
jgi:sn-glycerol 3-phosphate transport system ATP-binding protein